jgi:hypothetical protein
MYVGCAAYGFNAYLVEFDPKTEKMRCVIDADKTIGIPRPSKATYAAQAKIHTRNFTGPSGTIYVGTKQGYRLSKDDTADYPGGYVITYDPKTDTSKCLGMPFPGQGVIDTVADESRGLIYVVTCEDQHWMVFDKKTEKFTEPDKDLRLIFYAATLVEPSGRANAITKDSKLARYDPATGKVTVQDIGIDHDGKFEPFPTIAQPPTWQLAADGKTAYLIVMDRPNLYQLDLSGPTGSAVHAKDLGPMTNGDGVDSRCSVSIAPDGRVYVLIRENNKTGFGAGYLHILHRYDPKTNKMETLGVLAVKNQDFFDWEWAKTAKDGKQMPWTHGYHHLPDGVLTPMHAHMATVVAHDGTIYITILYPYTLLKIDPIP